MTAPFVDARRPEVVARVAYQLVKIYHRRTKGSGITPGQLISLTMTHPFVRDSLDFRLALSSMYYECVTLRGVSSKWLNQVITRSRAGLLFRGCFYEPYKANRRDPRVTNRGVRTPAYHLPAHRIEIGLGIREGDDDGN